MKQFHKIIALFIFIFITGIFITVIHINAPLNSHTSPESVKIQKDSIHFKQLNTKTI
ncbi:hypothetical protein KCTC32516_00841 [Polaribacter huanghezhanensis]|uniref:hypothetical protein n=1 Tax=Polaribacter huanghezhanensis TaxID=1354726 RepID=UPI002649C8FF|nr:hypothetical protein [Polaribacter huanghezhanensis]WKD85500.1 hypothetical protein KCTC32516_00841 [Polaribacter huanghezhanensis]